MLFRPIRWWSTAAAATVGFRNPSARAYIMSNSRLVDFLFTGLGVVPAALTFGGRLDLAVLLFFPLLLGACFAAARLEGIPGERG